MHPQMEMVRCVLMRGGTSKAVFLYANDLPSDPKVRDRVILSIFGSPDPRQIDGLGGSDMLTSKLAIIAPPSRPDADVDYLFAQVGVSEPVVDFSGNCGNISSAVGPFAVDEGLVRATEPVTKVRIHQVNTKRLIIAEVPVANGKALVEGDFAIDGVPGTGAPIFLDWSDMAGSITGKLLPTGHVVDSVSVGGRQYEISIVDAGNPLVFVRAESLGIKGTESADEIENNKPLMDLVEKIRGVAAHMLGFVDDPAKSREKSPYLPFFAIVSPPQAYRAAIRNTDITPDMIDITARMISFLHAHKTYPGSGTVCTGVACKIPGSVANQVLRPEARSRVRINIGHPAGIIPVEAEVVQEGKEIKLTRAAIIRTARRLMEGYVYVRKSVYAS